MKRTRFMFLASVLTTLIFSVSFAHSPIIPHESGLNMENAIEVKNIGISQVLYHEFHQKNESLWLTFDGKKGENLYFQTGIPKLDKFRDLRPTIAIVGPGLPAVSTLPFGIPEGTGALVFTSEGTPTVFHEPVTDTYSWILFSRNLALPENGRYYMVAYFPSGKTGNLFVAIGKKELFTPRDIVNVFGILPQIRSFYGLSGYPGWLNATVGVSAFLLFLFVVTRL